LIPNGIDIPPKTSTLESGPPFTALYLGRIHPKKGLKQLVAAWAFVEKEFTQWRLRIVGPSENQHAEELQSLVAALGLRHVSFEAPLFGPEKLAAYRTAAVSVLPTLNENFGLVVAEALAAGTPVICTKGAPWAGLVTEQCGWWIDHGVEPLAAALRTAMTTSQQLRTEMGQRGRDWMLREFSWERVARDMAATYRWAMGQSDRPNCLLV
jgi:glycosyltransferase involved in cell wall biosynthesis